MKGLFRSLILLSLLSWFWGCASVPSPDQRLNAAENMLKAKGWLRLNIDAPPFVLRAYLPDDFSTYTVSTDKLLTVYLEGDGYAWRSRSRPSADPTPIDPVGLRMALRHPGDRVAYLARPCQFVSQQGFTGCEAAFWTSRRFATEVVASIDVAISELMAKTSSTTLRLVGYSGGGAVAVLVAAQRTDVVQIITVAGNLDHAKWTELHSVSPLSGSLNPTEFTQKLLSVPQMHLVGGHDEIIPPVIAKAYLQNYPTDWQPALRIFPEYTHRCCWVENWPEIYMQLTEGFRDKE